MPAGCKRMVKVVLLFIGVKGHAGMGPSQNYGRGGGGGKPKKGPHQNKNNTPTWREK